MSAPVEELLRAYCAAIDARTDPAGVAARFWTTDGVLDNSAIGSAPVEGHAALTENFAQMFAAMEMLDHRLSDFRLIEWDDTSAEASARVAATARPKGGETFQMTGDYHLEAQRTDAGWKLSRLAFVPALRPG